jgi:hypothetical protein
MRFWEKQWEKRLGTPLGRRNSLGKIRTEFDKRKYCRKKRHGTKVVK